MKKDKSTPRSRSASPKPKLRVVVPFPEDRVVRDREIENLIRRLRRAKQDLSQVLILGLGEETDALFTISNGVNRKDALWMVEMAKIDILGLTEEQQ